MLDGFYWHMVTQIQLLLQQGTQAAHQRELVADQQSRARRALARAMSSAPNRQVYAGRLLLGYGHTIGSGTGVIASQEGQRTFLVAEDQQLLSTLEDLFKKSYTEQWRAEYLATLLESLYTTVTKLKPDPDQYISPATIIILNACREDFTYLLGANKTKPARVRSFKKALSIMYRWLSEEECPALITDWVLRYINNLEKMMHFDVLVDVTVLHLDAMLDAMANPASPIKQLAPVVVRILASVRELPEIICKISSFSAIIQRLEDEKTKWDWARDVLEDIVDVFECIIFTQMRSMTASEKKKFQAVHYSLQSQIEMLRRPEASCNKYLKIYPWRPIELTEIVIEPTTPGTEHRDVQTSLSEDETETKIGLLNLGNTCYLNSTIQALLLTREFSNHCMNNMSSLPIWAEMAMLFVQLNYSTCGHVNPEEFFMGIKLNEYIDTYQQQDSAEFLNFLLDLLQLNEQSEMERSMPRPFTSSLPQRNCFPLDLLQLNEQSEMERSVPRPFTSSFPQSNWFEDVGVWCSSPSSSSGSVRNYSSPRKRSTSPNYGSPRKRFRSGPKTPTLPEDSYIQATFGGTLTTMTKCTVCWTTSHNRDLFRDLQLGFPENAKSGQHSVQSLLEYYCSTELLTGHNRYLCSKCNMFTDAQRSVVIDISPKHLIVVLKLFKYEPQLQRHTKLIHKVHHNHRIYLTTGSRRSEKSIYDLYATVIHSGTALDSGHYYTIGNDDGQWYSFNDDEVQPCSKDDVNSLGKYCTPYILFYRRSNIEEVATLPAELELPTRKSCLRDSSSTSRNKPSRLVKRVRFNLDYDYIPEVVEL